MKKEKTYIRDLRDKYFQVDDEYLNGYARLCGINATGVYLSLCRHANKQQTCFPSKKLIAEELAISERSVYNAMKLLEKWGIIEIDSQGRKESGHFYNHIYTLRDKKFWEPKPQATGADGTVCLPPQANDDTHRRHEVPNKETHINQTHSKEIATVVAPAPFSLSGEIEKLNASTRRDHHIIALYLETRGVKFESKEQFTVALRRHLRPAGELKHFSNNQILDAIDKAKREYSDVGWTIESLVKILIK